MKKIMSFIFIVSVGLCLFNCSKTDESASIKFDEKFNDTDININKTVEQAFSGHWRGICNLNINRNYLQKLRESLNDKKNGSKETGQLTKEEFFLTNFFIDDMDQQPDTITYSVYIFEWFINNNYGKSNEYTITLLNEPCIGYDAKSAIYW